MATLPNASEGKLMESNLTAQDVRVLRKSLHLSQEDFAGRLGVTVRTLQRWEKHGRIPEVAARLMLMVSVGGKP